MVEKDLLFSFSLKCPTSVYDYKWILSISVISTDVVMGNSFRNEVCVFLTFQVFQSFIILQLR